MIGASSSELCVANPHGTGEPKLFPTSTLDYAAIAPSTARRLNAAQTEQQAAK